MRENIKVKWKVKMKNICQPGENQGKNCVRDNKYWSVPTDEKSFLEGEEGKYGFRNIIQNSAPLTRLTAG